MEFVPAITSTVSTATVVEVRTYRLLQELNNIESDSIKNPNGADNCSSDRDEQSGLVNGTVVIPCRITVKNGGQSVEILNPYETTENVVSAFFESALVQWLGEESLIHNPSQLHSHINLTQAFVNRASVSTANSNGQITVTITDLPTEKLLAGDYLSIKGASYLSGEFVS